MVKDWVRENEQGAQANKCFKMERILDYHKFRAYFPRETGQRFLALVAALSELVDVPDEVPRLVRDPKDDYLIACALAGAADYFVSGDKDLLNLENLGKIRIISARYFADEVLEKL